MNDDGRSRLGYWVPIAISLGTLAYSFGVQGQQVQQNKADIAAIRSDMRADIKELNRTVSEINLRTTSIAASLQTITGRPVDIKETANANH